MQGTSLRLMDRFLNTGSDMNACGGEESQGIGASHQ